VNVSTKLRTSNFLKVIHVFAFKVIYIFAVTEDATQRHYVQTIHIIVISILYSYNQLCILVLVERFIHCSLYFDTENYININGIFTRVFANNNC